MHSIERTNCYTRIVREIKAKILKYDPYNFESKFLMRGLNSVVSQALFCRSLLLNILFTGLASALNLILKT